jgi:hypothetical protein
MVCCVFIGKIKCLSTLLFVFFMVDYGVTLLDWLVGFGDGKKMWELGL